MTYEITLKRSWFTPTYTIGQLYLPGSSNKFCDTLEDTDRGLNQDPAKDSRNKVYGKTCIGYGRYRIKFINSPKFTPRFGFEVPELQDVNHFQNIEIHPGNTPEDTNGCILLGENSMPGKVLNSRYWVIKFLSQVRPAYDRGDEVYINIIK